MEKDAKIGVKDVESDKLEVDPYAYLKRDCFSSEAFKIEITQLPRYFGVKVDILFHQ